MADSQGRTRAVRRVTLPPAYATPADGPWFVEFVRQGGFTGGEWARLRVDSSKLTVSEGARRCVYTLTTEESAEVTGWVRTVRADLWFKSYVPANPSVITDAIYYEVALERAETSPYDNHTRQVRYGTELLELDIRPHTPADLVGLWDLLFSFEPDSYWTRYSTLCRSSN